MSDTGDTIYLVDRVPEVDRQLKELAARARLAGASALFFVAVGQLLARLQMTPHQLGDPEFRTRKKGGVVYHALVRPLIVQYVVFEADKLVTILKVRALPGSLIAE
jgi:hypothetical protein